MTSYVGLFGHPVRQNLSAIMHNAAFDALGIPWRYVLLDVEPGKVAEAVKRVVSEGWKGWNVTIPHKLEIVRSMDRLSTEAGIIGAVNTVQVTPEGLVGHNTDGAGCVMALREETGRGAAGLSIVQIGCGGAGRAVAVYLARDGAAELSLYDADLARAQELASLVSRSSPGVRARWLRGGSLPEAIASADMVVNATPIGMWPNVDAEPPIDPDWIPRGILVYDIINNPPRTRLLQAAEERGCRVLGGLPMLVMQGALAFRLWTGLDAPVDVMRRAAESAVSKWK